VSHLAVGAYEAPLGTGPPASNVVYACEQPSLPQA